MLGQLMAPPKAKPAKAKKCDKTERLDDMEMMRQLYYAMYNGMIKGLYHDGRKHAVNE